MRSGKAFVAGVGAVPFTKPGASDPYDVMAAAATARALHDARLDYRAIEQAIVGYVYGDSTSGQRALYRVGMTGIPIVNVNNNCSTGSTALYLARQLVESGAVDCVLALGFEQMRPGALTEYWNDRPSPFARFDELCAEIAPYPVPLALRYFGGAGREYMDRYAVGADLFARVRAKASRHAANNPTALLRKVVSEQEVLDAPLICAEAGMTRLMACPPTCGAAAAVLVSEDFARRMDLDRRVVIAAQAMTTDRPGTFEERSMIALVGADMSREAAGQVYEQAGIGPADLDVVELHDCFAQNEILTYEALGLCPEGGSARFVADGDNTYGGRVVTNPSGGLLCKGHPLGATGLAQCVELVEQLRGQAGARQVDNARIALQHNLGLGGACVVTLYQRSE
ncbi:lipid-transfer protein [Accumulibacter sp.]|uniref:lipid-transfer protein n=1 Tax=Accumulibacter sp. TaxID=2053492 RepID=UPI0025DFE829|nr:lipid-transfer protein [Accumulibacter sp.]MCM8595905.1 lipid-transfer protein [Accumulibacter sp.]MCM8626462.1 lipid-transfer protein [Accumulibacter sp.]MDS4050054.1 lipid-transfer protein [Accumulibacter sp.]